MTTIRATIQADNVPVNGLGDTPEIEIRRADTGAIVQAFTVMTDQGGSGLHTYVFVGVVGLDYSYLIDADPNANLNVPAADRYYDGGFDYLLEDTWNDRGLNPAVPKIVDEATPGSDIDEDVADASIVNIHKDVVKVGDTTTITRT